MTNTTKQYRNNHLGVLHFAVILCVFILALLLTLKGQECTESVKNGLSLCFFTVIPSLFPFLCIFEILRRSGAMEALSRLLSGPFCKIFALPPDAVCAVLSGLTCGAPPGINMACQLYREEKLTKKECERLICFCGCPSISFLVSGVGIGLYKDMKIGILLYFAVLFASLFCGIVLSFNNRKQFTIKKAKKEMKISFSATDFTESIISSTETTLKLCGFIVFFSVFCDMLNVYLMEFLPDIFSVIVFGIFEFVYGMNYSAALLPLVPSVVMCAAIAGWSGLSVHMQTIAIFGNTKLYFRKYFTTKLFIGLLSAVFTYFGMHYI